MGRVRAEEGAQRYNVSSRAALSELPPRPDTSNNRSFGDAQSAVRIDRAAVSLQPTALNTSMRVHEAVTLHANESPTAVAITEILDSPTDQSTINYTFKQLDGDSNRIACLLLERCDVVGGAETPIGVCMDGYRSVAALLGVVKTGNAYVPLDVSYPIDCIKYTANDSGMQIVLSKRKIAQAGPLAGGWFDSKSTRQIVELDKEWPSIEASLSATPLSAAQVQAQSDSRCYASCTHQDQQGDKRVYAVCIPEQ